MMAFHPTPSDTSIDSSPWKDNQGSLPPEIDVEGNVEYKLKLVASAPDRFDHLVTQLKWRLSEGHGSAIYEIGVADDGTFVGLSPDDMEVSLQTLYRMADALSADVTILRRVSVEAAQCQHLDQQECQDDQVDQEEALNSSSPTNTLSIPKEKNFNSHITAMQRQKSTSLPRTDPGFLVVEARVTTRLSRKHHFLEIRVALVGGPDAGKSTLLGRLAHGIADNGRGKARLNMLRHRHEISTGRTSSISHEIIGFDAQGGTVNYNTTHISTWQEICESSQKIVTLLDTCGHPRFLKTTIAGLTGHAPDYACLVVDSRVGGVNEMTKEHLALATVLGLPTFVVVTKMDVATNEQLRATVTALMLLIKRIGASCVDLASLETMLPKKTHHHQQHMRTTPNPASGAAVETIAATTEQPPARRFVPVIVQQKKDLEAVVAKFTNTDLIEATHTVVIPILLLSSVTGENLHLLEQLLYLLPKPHAQGVHDLQLEDPACFQIEEIYNIPDIGTVVGGFLHSGRIEVQDPALDTVVGDTPSSSPLVSDTDTEQTLQRSPRLYLGPVDSDGSFIPIQVKSIHRQRMSMRSIDSGQMATMALESPAPTIQFNSSSNGSNSVNNAMTMLETVKVRRGMVILESDTDPRGTCCQQFEAVIQVLAHEGSFGKGFQGMIHCGSVHQNAKIIQIRSLSDKDEQEEAEEDGTSGTAVELPLSTRLPPPPTPPPLLPKSGTATTTDMMMAERFEEELDELPSEGSITPGSEYGSGSTSSSVPGSRNGSIYQGKDRHSRLPPLQQRSGVRLLDEASGGGGKAVQAGHIPITTMRQLQRLSLQSRQNGTGVPSSQQPHDTSAFASSTASSLSNGHVQEKREEDDEEDDQAVQLTVGSRARVVFEFCHDVLFMREGTTVLFRQGRTKCIGKVVRMVS